ncbi:MAG: 2-oxo acid dehydrogenase subunit E2 [Candidatus Nanopelagicales bacterium]|nr:2-oxo acid dehydrogenase subunit E2 [Candidatus Nanopelagicales bacterium]
MSNLIDYKLADVGEGIAEAEVIEWLVAVGDSVKEDQPVVVVETDKSQIEIPAPVTGIVKSLGAKVGDVLAVGSNLMQIEATGAISKDIAAHASAPAVEVKQTSKSATKPARATNVRPLASPSTRKLAASLGADLGAIVGSGPNGRITSDDVINSKSGASTASPTPDNSPTIAQAGITLIQLRGLRRQIATSMSEALRIPHITEFKEIDATALMALRSELAPHFEKEGMKFSVTPLLLRACVMALQSHKSFNARFDSEMGEIRQYDDINLGFATATEDGLIVPVMRKANDFTVEMLAKQTEELAELAKTRKATSDQLGGGTFTVTNFGSFGTWLGTPIIRPPEAAIAGFGRIAEKVIPVDGVPAVRMVLPIVVAADHRINDGAHLGAFVSDIAKLLLNPESLVK